jgi:hypothetical protein
VQTEMTASAKRLAIRQARARVRRKGHIASEVDPKQEARSSVEVGSALTPGSSRRLRCRRNISRECSALLRRERAAMFDMVEEAPGQLREAGVVPDAQLDRFRHVGRPKKSGPAWISSCQRIGCSLRVSNRQSEPDNRRGPARPAHRRAPRGRGSDTLFLHECGMKVAGIDDDQPKCRTSRRAVPRPVSGRAFWGRGRRAARRRRG